MEFDIMKYKELLMSVEGAKLVSGDIEILMRCFYCSDSIDRSHGHFYISIPNDQESPSYFYCQKCQSSGIVTHTKLMEWGLFDQDISIGLAKYNKRIMKLSKNKKYIINDTIFNINNTHVERNDLSDKKLNYINNRLGLKLTYDDMISNKIVLNISDLLSQNNITEYTRAPMIIDQLNSFFIGFLSYDNGFLNMRNLSKNNGNVYKTIDKRYVNYNIFDKCDNTKKFYINPVSIDLNSPYPIKLHLVEGVFDLLSIKYNLVNGINNIYAAINGSGYLGLIKYFITTIKLINLEIHIYPDKDVNDNKMNFIARSISIFNNPIYIHRNIYQGEKDFGVKLDKIKENIRRIF